MTLTDLRRSLITDPARRAAYCNALRDVVAPRCPVNKMGASLVSDYDIVDADEEEQRIALRAVIKRFKLTPDIEP